MSSKPRPTRFRWLALLTMAVSVALACSNAKRPATTPPAQTQAHQPPKMEKRDISAAELASMARRYEAETRAELEEISASVMRRMESEWDAADGSGEVPTRDILLLSSGGQKGAFAAGFLEGWGSVGGELARPEFDIVTGVSTGALIAPFAFLGTEESYAAISGFYADPQENWIRRRGGALLSLLPGHVSLFNNQQIQERIRDAMSEDRVRGLAAEGEDGRLLLVGATNLDLGRGRVFNLVSEARQGAESGDLERVHRILLASSAIPVAFPPIEMDGFYYVDGGVSAQIFLLNTLDHLHGPVVEWRRRYPDRPPPRVRIWNIVSEPLAPTAKVLPPHWPAITGQTLSILMRSSLLTSLRYIEEVARDAHHAHGLEVEFRFVAIPDDAPQPTTHEMFEKEYMIALEELGRQMGADPNSWKTVVPDIQWGGQ